MSNLVNLTNQISQIKSDLATAITAKGVACSTTDAFEDYASKVSQIPSPVVRKYNLLDRVKDDNNTEIGTVSGFFTDANNVEYAVVCLDAQYRLDSAIICSDNIGGAITNLPQYNSTAWGAWEAKETATFNTQKILDYCTTGGYTSAACSHCRSKTFTIDGVSYAGQLPNMIELSDIMRNHTAINTADTTASSYTSTNFSTTRHMWSSTQASQPNFYDNYGSNMLDHARKAYSHFVIPVLEIPNN